MSDKLGFDGENHPWIKMVLTTGVVMYGKIPEIKNDLKLLEMLSKQSAFTFWYPLGVSAVGGDRLSYSPVAGVKSPPGDFLESPYLTMIRANVVYCGVITGSEQAKTYDRVKREAFSTIAMP